MLVKYWGIIYTPQLIFCYYSATLIDQQQQQVQQLQLQQPAATKKSWLEDFLDNLVIFIISKLRVNKFLEQF